MIIFECEVTSKKSMSFQIVIVFCASLWICISGQEVSPDQFTITLGTTDEIFTNQPHSPFIFNKDRTPSLLSTRIIGGGEAIANEYPFQVALYINIDSSVFFCGGSLITDEFILTAAHCVAEASNCLAILGAHDLSIAEDNRVTYITSTYFIHEDWNSNTLENDIALIRLPEKVTLNSYINTVTIASGADTYNGLNSRVLGWGKTSLGILSTVLRYVDAPIMTNTECSSYNGYANYILDHHLCTSGYGIVGSCNGDSGGPLLIDGIQVGIVSFGAENCSDGMPSVYTRVSEFSDWINEQLATSTTSDYSATGNACNLSQVMAMLLGSVIIFAFGSM